MITMEKTKLAWKLTLPFQHHDKRGSIYQTWNARDWWQEGRYGPLPFHWAQENVIVEQYGALRGLHCHSEAWLLMTCLRGEMVIGLLDPKTKETERFYISDLMREKFQVMVPPGIANGHCSLMDGSVFHYLWSVDYRDEKQETYKWDQWGIDWRIENPILSERDR